MIEVEHLRRVFNSRRGKGNGSAVALDDVTFSVAAGETHGLLGPNGAGKTTLVKILCTILLPSSGQARVDGHDVVTDMRRVRKQIGIVFGGDRGLYDRISARRNLMFWAAMYHVTGSVAKRRADELLELVGLTERADEPVERFSRGMRQRLHLARGLIGDPTVLFLDEPTVGMDPLAANEVRTLIKDVRAAGKTILLTTHDMREAEALCERVTVVDHGRILLTGDVTGIGRALGGHDRIDVTIDAGRLDVVSPLTDHPGVLRVDPLVEAGAFRVHTRAPEDIPTVLAWLLDNGITSVQTGQPTLEDVYVGLIGNRGLKV